METYGKKGASSIYTPEFESESNSDSGDYDDNEIDTNISNTSIETLINMSQENAWYNLIGKKTTENHPSVSKSEIEKRLVTITVPYRAWKGTGNDPRKDTIKAEAKITVNKLLADVWLSFFTDVYNEAPDFVISQFSGCYNYRKITNGSSLSPHAYGVACDINASTKGNGYYDTAYTKEEWNKLPNSRAKYQIIYRGSKVVQIAHKYTLVNGSDWTKHNDAMHFSFIADWNRSRLQACRGKVSC